MSQIYIPRPVPGEIGSAEVRAYLDRELHAIAIQFEQLMQIRFVISKLSAPLITTPVYQQLITEPVTSLNADKRSQTGWVQLSASFNFTGSTAIADVTIGTSEEGVTDPNLVVDQFTMEIGNRSESVTIELIILVENGLLIWAKGDNVTIDVARFVFQPMTPGGN